ncbi:MAG: YebC/PmpR family DNA-binding transcriptional regulator [Candidatus Dadabacteria bacterium]|nr:MAG: YebC/PmpR family DNA-binding transcriptional regulator [Candidatus Dadabacteria bacterium]
MSGHSKWHSIRHKKAIKDARRGKLFTKLIKEITVAARLGGGDISANPRLRTAVNTARANSMPAENIERAIKKGTGELEGVDYAEVTYEGYGPGGMAVMIEALTDNRNRTVAELRHLFSKYGGNLGENGCVSWMFDRVGHIRVGGEGVTEEAVFEIAADAGATDIRTEDSRILVVTEPDKLEDVRTALADAGFEIESAEIALEPKTFVRLTGSEAARALQLLEVLEDHDDVQRVSANFDIDDEELSRLSA